MIPLRCAGIAMVAGALAGLVALGLGGRLAMAALVLAAGGRPGFTLGGSLEVLAVGAGYGAVGGLLALGLLWASGSRPTRWHGIVAALSLLAIAWLTSRAGRSAAAGLSVHRLVAAGLAILCFLGYGVILQSLLACWLGARSEPRGAAA